MRETLFPPVSVLMPAFNSSKYISAAIESVLNQTWGAWELIIVDDGSTDDTLEIARRYQSAKVKVIRQQNAGAAAARNRAFSLCCGDYVQYLDADDVLDVRKIESQIRLLEQSASDAVSSCRWGHFQGTPVNVKLETQGVDRDIPPLDWLIESWSGSGMSQTACWLTPRSLIEESGGWDESLVRNPNDDGEFFCRVLLHASSVCFCRQAEVYYRSGLHGSVSRICDSQQAQSLLGSYISYRDNALHAEDSPRVRQALQNNFCSFAYEMDGRFPELAAEAIRLSSELGPTQRTRNGGVVFQLLQKAVGFPNALRLRRMAKRTFSG
jgi:glycosyltransferase involved in cell wall biosynthesis